MAVRQRGQVWHYQFQFRNQTICGTFPDAKDETEAKELEADERAKQRLGLRADTHVDDDFSKFVNDIYLKYSRENKQSYVHVSTLI